MEAVRTSLRETSGTTGASLARPHQVLARPVDGSRQPPKAPPSQDRIFEMTATDPPASFHVLVVDDDPTHGEEVARTVAELGYHVTVTATWTQALRAFRAQIIDLVLMDAMMPTVDGFKLTRILRGYTDSYVPILFLTGLADANSREQCVSAGADDFLSKPVDPLELKVRLKAMLRIRQLTWALEEQSRQLETLAHNDPLTGIANRRSFAKRIDEELERARRTGGALSLLMLDIDHFKRVNDTFGHAIGDDVLSYFGDLLERTSRGCDVPFRLGGEEFAILAPDSDEAAAEVLAERVRETFETQSEDATAAGRLTVSIGIASTAGMPVGVTAAQLTEAADRTLYAAKRKGRNRVCLHPCAAAA